MAETTDRARTVSRHTLAYMLLSISEMMRHYEGFDPIDLLIVHAIINGNVVGIMRSADLDLKFSSLADIEPDEAKNRVSRAAISRFLHIPIETVRRRVGRLKKIGVLSEDKSGLIIDKANMFRFGNNHKLQTTNMLLVKQLLTNLKRAGISSAKDCEMKPRSRK